MLSAVVPSVIQALIIVSLCSGNADSGGAVPHVQHGSYSQADGGWEGARGWAPYEPSGHATRWPQQR